MPPKSVQPAAKRALAEIRDAEEQGARQAAVKAFADEVRAKWPKAVDKITDKVDELLAFYDCRPSTGHLKTHQPD